MKRTRLMLAALVMAAVLVLITSCPHAEESQIIDNTSDVASAKSSLTISFADGDSEKSVTKNITLPEKVGDVSVTWTSNNHSVITASGIVTRPSFASGNTTVTLTATLSKGTASDTKVFNLTVIALSPVTYTVTFNSQGADIPARPNSMTVTQPATTVRSLPNAPEKAGFTFDGWFTEPDGRGTRFTASSVVSKNMIVYAKWTAATKYYNVSFDTGVYGTAPASQRVAEGSYAARPNDPVPTINEYIFDGWFADSDCTTAFDFSSTITANLTVYAKWTEATKYYNVSFNTGVYGTAPASQRVAEGSSAIKPEDPTPTINGYIFDGWFSDSDCTTTFDFSTPITANLTIYAKWLYGILITPENAGFIDLSTEFGELTLIVKGDFSNKFLLLNSLIIGYSDAIILDMSGVTGIRKIPDQVFAGFKQLKSVTLPGSILAIGEKAFYECSGISSIEIPDGVLTISEYAFADCPNLTSITIPASVTDIGVYAFGEISGSNAYNAYNIRSINYTGTLEQWISKSWSTYRISSNYNLYIDDRLITDIIFPDGITSISSYAFYGCSELASITIPDSVTSIGEYAFCNCTELTNITIPDSVTSIGDGAFCDCSGLTSITLSDNITNIGMDTFNCTALTSITIPASVTSIGSLAFYGCSELASITIPDSVTSIGAYAFYGCSNLSSAVFEDPNNWQSGGYGPGILFDSSIGNLSDSSNAASALMRGDRLYKNN